MKKKVIFLLLLSFLLPLAASAHQPRIASGVEIQTIEEAEVSKAYYGSLKGEPEYYQINSEHDFKFYVNVLVPDLPEIKKDISLEVYKGDYTQTPFLFLDGTNFPWKRFYEEFGGDYYFMGPEYRTTLAAGLYTIKVFSPDNEGKYVLAVGEKEVFNFSDILDMIYTLPVLKKDFFNKSPLMALYNVFGEWLIIGLAVAILLLAGIIYGIAHFSKKKEKKKK